MDKLLEKLLSVTSVSGREDAIRAVLAMAARAYGEISTDHLGNLVVHRAGRGKRIMLSAHMDTVGIIVTHIDDKGFVRFGKIGGLHVAACVGQRVRFENGVIGVIYCERGVDEKDLTLDKLYLDLAGQSVLVGQTAAFCEPPVFSGDYVFASHLDNRLGCAVCLKALELLKKTDNDIFCTFSVQEELGYRGAGAAAFSINPDFAIAVDICGVSDTPGDEALDDLTLDGGPVVKLMDKSAICHKSVCELLERSAESLKIPYQRYVAVKGGTDTGAIQRAAGGIPSGCLGIPIRYTHSPNELANRNVAMQCAMVLAAALDA